MNSDLTNIESLINSHDSRLNTLTQELKTQKSMLNDLLANNEEYTKTSEESSKLAKLKTLAKQKALKQPAAVTLVEKIKDCQMQVKELRVALSDYLTQYVNLSGTNQIETEDGVIRQIIYTARLVKKTD
jgi:chromosome segregation ATPase